MDRSTPVLRSRPLLNAPKVLQQKFSTLILLTKNLIYRLQKQLLRLQYFEIFQHAKKGREDTATNLNTSLTQSAPNHYWKSIAESHRVIAAH